MIDKIDGISGGVRSPQPVRRVVKSSAGSGASFAREIGETEESALTGGIASASSISGILNIQEVDDALSRASRGKMRAEDILDRLEDLRIELLSGTISCDKLMQLSRIVNARREQIKDPRLAEILDAIDLRAQVELAKHSQA